jgi:predicted dehydrogenase
MKLGIAIIGTGGITLQNHLPGLALCPDVKVTALCDANQAVLDRAAKECSGAACACDYNEVINRDDVQALIIATPNFLHAPIAIAAAKAGKHIFCEKPLALNFAESLEMYQAAKAAKVRHMTAFTYRFVPAMRYFEHLVKSGALGQPYHFRNARLQDWGTRAIGWRQTEKLAGSGELGDMLSHRIDFAHNLIGTFKDLVADTTRVHEVRDGQKNELEDWVAILARFSSNTTGVLESTKMATARGESAHSPDYVEVNGSEGTVVYYTGQPLELQFGKKGERGVSVVKIPQEFLKVPGSPRDPQVGDPLFNWRYDQTWEWISAIREERDCRPSFYDGAVAQQVMDCALQSAKERRWVTVPPVVR